MRAIALLLLIAAGCGRSPGPNEEEYGLMVAWQLDEASLSSTCSDAPRIAELLPEMPELGGSMVYYLVYSADPGGTTATDYTCPTPFTRWEDCKPTDGQYEVQGHTVFATATDSTTVGSGCTLETRYKLSINDDGDEGSATQAVALSLEGPTEACAAFEQRMRAESSNGLGVNGCSATLSLVLQFVLVKDW